MISVYRENGKCGLRRDGSVMLQPVFDEIGDFVGDYAIATLAKGLGHMDIYEEYRQKASNWENLWNPVRQ